jgi:hypothetical protein
MCDYSLTGLRTRLAVEGEELVLYRFPTGSIGLTSPAELEAHRKEFRGWQRRFDPREVPCAVCIPPGACLLLHDIPDHLQKQLGVGVVENVVFTQRSAEVGDIATGFGSQMARKSCCSAWPSANALLSCRFLRLSRKKRLTLWR